MDKPKPHEKRICLHCGTQIEWVSEAPEEGWEYDWYHVEPSVPFRRTGNRRCPIYAEPE